LLRNPIKGTTLTLTLEESGFNRKVKKINVDGIKEARKKERNNFAAMHLLLCFGR
jgi:hypothetical protein